MPHNTLVLGAGELGFAVLSSLTSHIKCDDTSITVLLRPDSATMVSQKEFFTKNHIGVYELDIVAASEKDLTAAFRDMSCEIVIGCTGMTYPPGTQSKIARAVLATEGVERYFPWQFGVDYDAIGRSSSQDLFTEQLDVRDLLRGQTRTRWRIVSTGMFMSFLFEEVFGVVSMNAQKVRALGSWDTRVTVTDVGDIGRVVAELVFDDGGDTGVVYTAGDTISYRQVADLVVKIRGTEKMQREEWDLFTLRKDLEADPDNGMKKYRIVFGEGKGVSWDVQGTFNQQRGMKLMGLEEGAKKYLKSS